MGTVLMELAFLPVEEAGTAWTQPGRGITWWADRDDELQLLSFRYRVYQTRRSCQVFGHKERGFGVYL